MYFYNEQNRNLEAELQFPLADGQTISYFAMDVNGEMRSGVAVEKVKARMAYEATVRQGIDPGLIEKTQGNNFKLRVFPVPSKGTKHIIIEYMHELAMDVKHAYYHLPLFFKEKIPVFSYHLSIVGACSVLRRFLFFFGSFRCDFHQACCVFHSFLMSRMWS